MNEDELILKILAETTSGHSFPQKIKESMTTPRITMRISGRVFIFLLKRHGYLVEKI
ncbi:MAG: hypothetical protein GXP60_07470 [Epsilonproteobacteria bacterium]|nr:hypothetical protein [Campylobacterota bacterium]